MSDPNAPQGPPFQGPPQGGQGQPPGYGQQPPQGYPQQPPDMAQRPWFKKKRSSSRSSWSRWSC